MRGIPGGARALILCAVVCAAACALPALLPGARVPWGTVALIAAVYAVCELPARGPFLGRFLGGSVPLSAGSFFPVLLAAALLLPPAAAALAAVPGAVVAGVEQRPAGPRRLWRAAQLALAAWAAAWAAVRCGGLGAAPDFPRALLPAGAAALAFCLVLTALDGAILATAERLPPRAAWGGPLSRSLAPHTAHGLAGLMMAVLWRSPYGPLSALFVLLPMYISCWVFTQYHREQHAHRSTIRALVQAVDIKDRYTRGHSERVGRASVLIASELGMDEERLEVLRFAGILHDVGKLGVPTRVLRKDGPLTPEERRVIELHPEYGHEMVRGIGFLGEARAAILHHHERLDGSGYPYGLAGRQIPEFARVVAVADAFDAMTSTRSYRRARPVATAVEELKRCSGTQFDPQVVRALVRALARHGWQSEVTADEPPPPGAPPSHRGASGVPAPAPADGLRGAHEPRVPRVAEAVTGARAAREGIGRRRDG
ncbi:HD-GYP domain-containing protein [Streptomyces sp. FIT100]|uniref:HD-GYP domain-containing protein n=1 Tax=Streptomyces sp. FIT100 TaxID=2837956 RepID=UPI0021C9A370|nr:HD-GYP domain-containing protein [Streptomyces sp. FIT100]UUN29088.1 HD-GYP domain-containing protein [Streptomyces sp. FIT100]